MGAATWACSLATASSTSGITVFPQSPLNSCPPIARAGSRTPTERGGLFTSQTQLSWGIHDSGPLQDLWNMVQVPRHQRRQQAEPDEYVQGPLRGVDDGQAV